MEVKYILGISVLALCTLFAVVWSSMGVSPSYYAQTLQTVTDNGAITNNSITIPDDGLKTVNNTASSFLVNDGISYTPVLMSGDASMASDGTITVIGTSSTDSVVVTAKVNQVGGIAKGQIVYITGATGGFPQVAIADNVDFSKADVLAIATESKADGQQMVVTISGLLENIDTSAFTEGAVIYLGVNGSIQTAHPTGIDAVQRVGHIVKSNVATGSILVEMDQLSTINDHNGIVRIQVVNQNKGSSASGGYTVVNDINHRASFTLTGSNFSVVPSIGAETAVIFNQGYGKTVNAIDGNEPFEWWTDVNGYHNLSATVKMSLSAVGDLDVVGDIKVNGDMVSSDGTTGWTGTCATSLVVKNGIVVGCV